MSFDLVKTVVIIGNHMDSIPLLLDTAGKVKAAENAVQIVDATVPAQYDIARIVDDVRASSLAFGDDNFDTHAAKVCEAFNGHPGSHPISGKRLLTIDNLRTIAELIAKFAPLLGLLK